MISLEKLKILTPIRKLHRNVRDLGKLIVATGFEWLPKVQKIAQSGHTGCAIPWAVSLSLDDDKLFFGPKHNIYTFFMIIFGLFELIPLFFCQTCHVNCETENLEHLSRH